MTAPELFYDLGSPYAYLTVERAERVLGVAPVLRPVLLGAIFAARGHGSWSAKSHCTVEPVSSRPSAPPVVK